jgi:hypothetical protein
LNFLNQAEPIKKAFVLFFPGTIIWLDFHANRKIIEDLIKYYKNQLYVLNHYLFIEDKIVYEFNKHTQIVKT